MGPYLYSVMERKVFEQVGHVHSIAVTAAGIAEGLEEVVNSAGVASTVFVDEGEMLSKWETDG